MVKYVYQFTNGRELTKAEFLKWFRKKFLYVIRKFGMIEKGDVLGFRKKKDFRSVVLEDLLDFFVEKAPVKVVRLPKKSNKIVESTTSDQVSEKLTLELFKGDISKLKLKPVSENTIRPLYLFLDKEILLYAKLKGLKFKEPKFKQNKISKFIRKLESKHLELKHSIVKSYLEIFN